MKSASRLLAVALFVLAATPLAAQPPAPPNPQAPNLAPVQPLGVQRGTSIDLTLTGTNLQEPTGLWTSFPARVTIPTDAKNGTLPTSLRVKLEVPRDAPLGFHTIRLATKRGMSNARLFCVDDLPQVLENNTNRTPKTAQAVPVPCVVIGRADAEATDYFKVTVKANQRLAFEVLGRRLGSAFDPQLTLLDAATERELPGGFSNDAPGLQTDARVVYTFKNAGDVLVAIRDVSYRGGADFHYRLRIGDFPCATTPLPLAVKRGSKTQVRFSGPAVEGVSPVEVQAPTDPAVTAIQVAPKGASGLHGWPVELHLSDLDEQLEKEPNNDPKQANRINVPGAITARFEEKDDTDCFVVKLLKGKRYIIEAHSSEHHSPTEVYMVLRNDKGAQLSASNPALAPRLDFTAPADGDYTLAVEHLHSWGGPDEVYRVTVTPFEPSYSLTLNIDRWDVAPGGTVSIPIFLARAGYNGPVEVSVLGPKGISGSVTIPAGPPKPPNVPSAVLPLKADELPAGPLSFAIQGKATIEGKAVVHLASARNVVAVGLANLAVPPRATFTQLGLAVTQKPPFTLTAKFDAAFVPPGKPITATITLARQPGFTAEVTVTYVGLLPGVKSAPVKVPAAQTTAKATFTLPPNAKLGPMLVTFVGAAKHNGRDWQVRSAAVQVLVKK